MTEKEHELLSRIFFQSCLENVQSWKELNPTFEENNDLSESSGYKAWRRSGGQGITPKYEANRKLILSAEKHLNSIGYQTTSIRSATPTTVSVWIARASSWKLCVRVPKDMVERILILGFVPDLTQGD